MSDTAYTNVDGFAQGDVPLVYALDVKDADGEPITAADISTIKATALNMLSLEYVLEESALVKADVWEDEAEQSNFKWRPAASLWRTTDGNDGQFKVEVEVTPVTGDKTYLRFILTSYTSILPIPDDEE